MADVIEIINWVLNNKALLIEGYLALVGLASVITRITPTLKDDHWFKAYIKFIGKYFALGKYGPDGE